MKKIIKKILKSKITQIALSVLIYLYLWFVYLTSVTEIKFADEKDRELCCKNSYMMVFWHGRLAMMAFVKIFIRKKISVLISQHSDGRIIAYVMNLFGIGVISGSSTRGWFSAFKEIKRLVSKKGEIVAITPDGPKGPGMKIGDSNVTKLATMFNLKICPAVFAAKRKKTFRSWDSFIFPYPFNKIVFYFDRPIDLLKKDMSDEDKKFLVEKSMNDLSKKADEYVKGM